MYRPGELVYTIDGYGPFEILDVLLANDYPDDPEATEDLIVVKKHRTYPAYNRMDQWERDFTAMWGIKRITKTPQLKLEL